MTMQQIRLLDQAVIVLRHLSIHVRDDANGLEPSDIAECRELAIRLGKLLDVLDRNGPKRVD